MEKSPSWPSLPPDSAERSALLIFFASIACACLALFGERLPLVCLGFSAACTLLLLVCLRLQRSHRTGSGFTLDDDARAVIPRGSRPIPFGSIVFFRLTLFRDLACMHVISGRMRRRRALACVHRPGPVQDILQALYERGLNVRVSKNPFKKRTADLLPLLIMPLLAAAMLYINIEMFRRFPVLALPPQPLSVESLTSDAFKQEHVHQLGPFSFFLPREYRLLSRQEHTALFHNPDGNVRLAIDTTPARKTVPQRPVAQRLAGLLGFGNVHDAAALAVRSRIGLLPLLLKSALLKSYDPRTVQLYNVQAGRLTGVMLRGEQPRTDESSHEDMPDQVAEVVLNSAEENQSLRILIASRRPLDSRWLQHLIAGIH